MALPNLHGYWKYADAVVPFRIEPVDRPQVASSFIARPAKPVIQKQLNPQPLALAATTANADANGNGNGSGKQTDETASEMSDELDVRF